jgi:hypothetical protein
MIVISTPLSISSSVRDIERLLRESPPFKAGKMSRPEYTACRDAEVRPELLVPATGPILQ